MINNNTSLVIGGSGLSRYLEDIKKFPMLSMEEEYSLAKAWVGEASLSARLGVATAVLVAVGRA